MIERARLEYRRTPGVYDEFLDAHGSPRPRWAPLLENPVPQHGGEETDASLPGRLDPFPYLVDAEEWRTIESGLVQRARLLNALAADFYGPQQLLRQQGLPPALLFANPGYLPQCRGYRARDGIFLNRLAFDLGRSPDGVWRVLANRTDLPAGLGIALQNRLETARLLPGALEDTGIAGLEGYFDELANPLREGESAVRDGLCVLLAAGAHPAGDPDHALLGRRLGLAVVEGSDLTVRGSGVYLKTPDGPKPVQTIVRAIDSLSCDPLELSSTSLQGTPGLLACAAGGRVQISNAIGSGVVENPAISGFLPGLCRAALDEALILPDLATWWCGQPREAGYVADRLDSLVLRRAFDPAHGNVASGLLPGAAGVDVETARREMAQRPYDYVGREPMLLSTMPWWAGKDKLQPAPFTLRLFVAATRDGYRVMPGGLARVATPRGDLGKDVWVMGEGR